MPKRQKISFVWSYFTVYESDKKTAKCDLCGQICCYKSTVSNLKKHITSKHPTVNIQKRQPENQPEQSASLHVDIPEATPSTSTTTSTHTEDIQGPSTKTISQTSILSFAPPKKLTEQKKKRIDNLLLRLFTQDYQPFSIVEDKGFRKFIQELNPSYQLPNRKMISQSLIPAEYEKCMTVVRSVLHSAQSFCLTTDTWTSKNVESYIAVTVHFIQSFKVKSVLLSCEKLTGSHTSENLGNAIRKITDKFGLSRKILVCVTDNAANIVSAVKDFLKWRHFPCLAHTINLIVQDGLKTESILIDKVKSIVSHFKRSTSSMEKLLTTQQNMGLQTKKKLIQSVETRWNSTYYMLERFSDLEDPVKMTLALLDTRTIVMLSAEEWQKCKGLCKILKPFEEISREMSGENYVTGSQIIVMVRGLKNVLHKLKNQLSDPDLIRIIEIFEKSILSRLKNLEYSNTIGLSTLLDPRFKFLPFSEQSAIDKIKKDVILLLEKIISDSLPPTASAAEESLPKTSSKTDVLSVWGDFEELMTTVAPKGTFSFLTSAYENVIYDFMFFFRNSKVCCHCRIRSLP